jgi:hypothetical protein
MADGGIAFVPVERLCQSAERFRCLPLGAVLTAGACVQRQCLARAERGAGRLRQVAEASRGDVALEFVACRRCATGEQVAQAIGATLPRVAPLALKVGDPEYLCRKPKPRKQWARCKSEGCSGHAEPVYATTNPLDVGLCLVCRKTAQSYRHDAYAKDRWRERQRLREADPAVPRCARDGCKHPRARCYGRTDPATADWCSPCRAAEKRRLERQSSRDQLGGRNG